MTSGLVAECLDALTVLANMSEVTLIWVPGHCGILGNEEADKPQLCRYLVRSRLLEYLSVRQEKQSRTGLSINTTAPGEICQVLDMANFL